MEHLTYHPDSCAVCGVRSTRDYDNVDGVMYSECMRCGSLFANCRYLTEVEAGATGIEYSDDYWLAEIPSARERAWGEALARMAEALHYCRIPITTFVDIGTGPGFFLDATEALIPASADHFYGVELFPPPEAIRTRSPRYIHGGIGDIGRLVECGMCIEVVEHLTPNMFGSMLEGIAACSAEGAFYLFNTGMPDFVRREDPRYLDPHNRGHIVSYSAEGVRALAEPRGFTVLPFGGRTWAFGLEYGSLPSNRESASSRIWTALESNLNLLVDQRMGSVLRLLGRESARVYS